tara:strand:- start:4154 stop:4498 length:345 start_codon:yes stop_codon:yes gene_type:complete
MIDSVKKYIENRIQLLKLELISVLANLSANLISSFFISLFIVVIGIMFSFSIAYFIGHYYENTALGFAAVGGIYTVVFLIYMKFIKKNIENKVKDAIVQAAFKAEKEITEKNDE